MLKSADALSLPAAGEKARSKGTTAARLGAEMLPSEEEQREVQCVRENETWQVLDAQGQVVATAQGSRGQNAQAPLDKTREKGKAGYDSLATCAQVVRVGEKTEDEKMVYESAQEERPRSGLVGVGVLLVLLYGYARVRKLFAHAQ